MLDAPKTLEDLKNKSFAESTLTVFRKVVFNIPVMPSKTLILLHTPKTAGTNLSYISDALSKVSPHFQITRFAVPRAEGRSPGYISNGWQGGLETARAKLQVTPHFCDEMNFISGHFPLGLHELLTQSAQYITLIRHPVERELSTANFDFQRGYVQKEHFEEYVLSALDNPQVRMIAGQMSDECTEETLEKAKSNIEKYFMLVGVTEMATQFMEVLASIQGWGPIAIAKAQVTGVKAVEDPSEKFVEHLSNKHQFDLQLYSWARQRWLNWYESAVAEVVSYSQNEKVLCLASDYATTKTPIQMTVYQIDTYNGNQPPGLVEISQNHTKAEAPKTPMVDSPLILNQFSSMPISKVEPGISEDKTTSVAHLRQSY